MISQPNSLSSIRFPRISPPPSSSFSASLVLHLNPPLLIPVSSPVQNENNEDANSTHPTYAVLDSCVPVSPVPPPHRKKGRPRKKVEWSDVITGVGMGTGTNNNVGSGVGFEVDPFAGFEGLDGEAVDAGG